VLQLYDFKLFIFAILVWVLWTTHNKMSIEHKFCTEVLHKIVLACRSGGLC